MIVLPKELENTFIIIWYIVSLIYLIESYITWYFNVYIVTDKRVIDVDFTPLFNKKVSEAPYENIEDSSYSTRNLFQVTFNYGDVMIQTAAEQREFEFTDVPNPNLVQDIISDYAALAQKK